MQIQVLILLRKLQKEFGMGVIFVTHDLGVAAQIADKVAVMYAGRIVEYGNVRDVLMRPTHPYTIGMLASTVHGGSRATPRSRRSPAVRPTCAGCRPAAAFAPRCKYADRRARPPCRRRRPVAPGRLTCCFKAGHLTRAEPQQR